MKFEQRSSTTGWQEMKLKQHFSLLTNAIYLLTLSYISGCANYIPLIESNYNFRKDPESGLDTGLIFFSTKIISDCTNPFLGGAQNPVFIDMSIRNTNKFLSLKEIQVAPITNMFLNPEIKIDFNVYKINGFIIRELPEGSYQIHYIRANTPYNLRTSITFPFIVSPRKVTYLGEWTFNTQCFNGQITFNDQRHRDTQILTRYMNNINVEMINYSFTPKQSSYAYVTQPVYERKIAYAISTRNYVVTTSIYVDNTIAVGKQEMVTKIKEAVADIKYHPKTALAEFDKKDGKWAWNGNYLFVLDCAAGIIKAHPSDSLRGTKITDLKDKVTGKEFGTALCSAAKNPDGGWVEFMWNKPGT